MAWQTGGRAPKGTGLTPSAPSSFLRAAGQGVRVLLAWPRLQGTRRLIHGLLWMRARSFC